jgi:hypothetical protein
MPRTHRVRSVVTAGIGAAIRGKGVAGLGSAIAVALGSVWHPSVHDLSMSTGNLTMLRARTSVTVDLSHRPILHVTVFRVDGASRRQHGMANRQ